MLITTALKRKGDPGEFKIAERLYVAMPGAHEWWLRQLAAEGFAIQYKSFQALLA